MGKWCRCPSSLIDADCAVVRLGPSAIALSRIGQQQFGCTLLAAVAVTMHDAVQFGAGLAPLSHYGEKIKTQLTACACRAVLFFCTPRSVLCA